MTKGELVPVQTYLYHLMNMDMSQTYRHEQQQAAAQAMTRITADYATITSLSLRMAAVMVALIPILLVYPFLQRYFVKGVLIGSIKE